MAQHMIETNCKIIISVRVAIVKSLDTLSNYSPFFDGCFDIYKMLMAKYGSMFNHQDFTRFLESLSLQDEAGEDSLIFQNLESFNYKSVFENDNFITWISDNNNKDSFLSNLCQCKDLHLLRKHNSFEIYIVPTYSDTFAPENVSYIELLVNKLKKGDEEVYLLLHDKDLYETGKECHHASPEDSFGLKDMHKYETVWSLINSRKVFVFKHDTSVDDFYNNIVLKLDELSIDGFMKALAIKLDASNFTLSEILGKLMSEEEMKDALKGCGSQYDFTKSFLDLNEEYE